MQLLQKGRCRVSSGQQTVTAKELSTCQCEGPRHESLLDHTASQGRLTKALITLCQQYSTGVSVSHMTLTSSLGMQVCHAHISPAEQCTAVPPVCNSANSFCRDSDLDHFLWLEVHKSAHHIQACEKGGRGVQVVMGIVLQQLGDVVDLDCRLGPHAEGFTQDCLGMHQQSLCRWQQLKSKA